jgi:hypothetical protein
MSGTRSRRAWAQAWADKYPRENDEELRELAGVPSLGLDELGRVVAWKTRGLWSPRALARLATVDEAFVRDVTERAFSNGDDLAALLILTVLPSVGIPVASAVLTTHDPNRFTVADRRAWTSVQALGSLTELDGLSWERRWLPYLKVCRQFASERTMSLREVDRALYRSNGNLELPLTSY